MSPKTAHDWIADLYRPHWTARFERLARERYGRYTDAAELAADARQKLALRLAGLTAEDGGRALTDGYLLVAFKHALIDCYRERRGRPEPRQWLRAYGPLGRRIFELYCLTRQRFDEVLTALRADPELAAHPAVNPAQVQDLLREIDRRQECAGREEVSLNQDDPDAGPTLDPPAPGDSPEAALARRQAEALQALLFTSGYTGASEPLFARLAALLADSGGTGLSLDTEEAFILRGFLADLTERRIGELLGGLSVRQVRYRRQGALAKLARLVHQAGIGLDDLLPQET
jgi:hypothetical protein